MSASPEERKKYLAWAVAERRRKLKEMAVEYKGGRCMDCGYQKCQAALHFHHRDPAQKEFGVSVNGMTRTWEAIRVELDKCDLICANCHAERHEAEDAVVREAKRAEVRKCVPAKPKAKLVHGTRNGYNFHGCRCVECKKASSDAHREWRSRKA